MRLIMQTKGVMDRITTPAVLEKHGLKYEILCHTDADAKRLRRRFGVKCHPCYPPEDYRALGWMRDWMIMNLVSENSWYVGCDDNISEVYYPKSASGEEVDEDPFWRDDFMTPCVDLAEQLNELTERCHANGTVYGGCGYIDNYFFRRKHWSDLCYVKAKLYVAFNDLRPWCYDEGLGLMLDHAKTFDVIARYGRVVVNKWLFPAHPRFQSGGLGTLAERMPYRLMSCEVFKRLYDGLVVIKEGESGEMDNPQIRLRSLKAVEEWRKANGHLK